MGSCKQLLDLGGRSVIARCLETLLTGGIADIVVVIGPQGGALAAEVRRYPVTVVHTVNPDGDMADSVRIGCRSLSPATSGVLISPCDHPLVRSATVVGLAAEHQVQPGAIIIPFHDGRKGHPTLFPRQILDELLPGSTLRDLVRRDPERVRPMATDDPGVLDDMDTPEDYRRLLLRVATVA